MHSRHTVKVTVPRNYLSPTRYKKVVYKKKESWTRSVLKSSQSKADLWLAFRHLRPTPTFLNTAQNGYDRLTKNTFTLPKANPELHWEAKVLDMHVLFLYSYLWPFLLSHSKNGFKIPFYLKKVFIYMWCTNICRHLDEQIVLLLTPSRKKYSPSLLKFKYRNGAQRESRPKKGRAMKKYHKDLI